MKKLTCFIICVILVVAVVFAVSADITITCATYPFSYLSLTKEYSVKLESKEFVVYDNGGEVARGNHLELSSSMKDLKPESPLLNDFALCRDEKEVFRSQNINLYITNMLGEIEIVDAIGCRWRIVGQETQFYPGGRNFTFAAFRVVDDRSEMFTQSFLSDYSGSGIILSGEKVVFVRDINQSPYMLSPSESSGFLEFRGKEGKLVLSYPMNPAEYMAQVVNGSAVYPSRITIINNKVRMWRINPETSLVEILGEKEFTTIAGELELKTAVGVFVATAQPILNSWYFISYLKWPDGTKTIQWDRIGDTLRFSCLHVPKESDPKGFKPEIKLFGIEQSEKMGRGAILLAP